MFIRNFIIFGTLVVLPVFCVASYFQEGLDEMKSELAAQDIDDAIDELEDLKDKKLSEAEKAQKYFMIGKLFQDMEAWEKSRAALDKALSFPQSQKAYIHYLKGHAFKEEGRFEEAISEFDQAIRAKPARNIVYDSRFELSELLAKGGKATKAHAHLKYLERRWRGSVRHGDIVWRLIGVELQRKRKWMACRWARQMYAKYAGHSLAQDWGVDLPNNEYQGQLLGCLAAEKDIKNRIKRLQLYGMSDRARRELEVLKKRDANSYVVDEMWAQYWEWQGYPSEALNILVKHYESKQSDYDYMKFLGKVASKAGEYDTAVGAYYKAYKANSKSIKGRKALFSAAFLSYQFQDYDGASRKFQELQKKFPNTGLARDAKWHLAWIRYLKKDYDGAEGAFKKLLTETYRLRRRRYRPFNNDRTKYWLAMSHLRQREFDAAKNLFKKIADEGLHTYYSILARTRLKETKEFSVDRVLASAEGARSELEAEDFKLFPFEAEDTQVDSATESEESEDTLSLDEREDEAEETEIESPEEAEEEKSFADRIETTTFKNPKLQARLERAKEFMALGLTDWAKWELYEIEKRTRNKTYLRQLMDIYHSIGSYNRSLSISGVYFSKDRSTGGFSRAKDLWQWNFPRAFQEPVESSARKFSVDPLLMYSIMRAESNFRKEALSPVGARGLMQIMPYTAEQIAKLLDDNYDDLSLSDVEVNITYGARYLSRLQKKFYGLITLVAAGYNAGPHRVLNWLNTFGNLDMDEFIEHIPFVETRNYVKKVLRHYYVYNFLYTPESDLSLAWMASPLPRTFSVPPSPRENWESLD